MWQTSEALDMNSMSSTGNITDQGGRVAQRGTARAACAVWKIETLADMLMAAVGAWQHLRKHLL